MKKIWIILGVIVLVLFMTFGWYTGGYNKAIAKDEEGKAHVTEVLCKGCGSCRASCPEKAICAPHFTIEQIVAEIKAMARKEAA